MRNYISCWIVLSWMGVQGCGADGYDPAGGELSDDMPSDSLALKEARKPRRCKEHHEHKHCPPSPTAIAIELGQIPPTPGGPDWEDRERLLVVVSNAPLSCADPFGGLDCREWQLGFSLPPELQVPGTLPLADERMRSYTAESWPNIEIEECWYGTNAPAPGTVEIQTISDEGLTVAITGAASGLFDASGVYDIQRCP